MKQDTIALLRTRPVAVGNQLNITFYHSECQINTRSPVQPQLVNIGHRMPSDEITDLGGCVSHWISVSGQGKYCDGQIRDEQSREKSFAVERRALLSAEHRYGSMYVCSACLGRVTGVGTARDRDRQVVGRFHTCLPHLIRSYVCGG